MVGIHDQYAMTVNIIEIGLLVDRIDEELIPNALWVGSLHVHHAVAELVSVKVLDQFGIKARDFDFRKMAIGY